MKYFSAQYLIEYAKSAFLIGSLGACATFIFITHFMCLGTDALHLCFSLHLYIPMLQVLYIRKVPFIYRIFRWYLLLTLLLMWLLLSNSLSRLESTVLNILLLYVIPVLFCLATSYFLARCTLELNDSSTWKNLFIQDEDHKCQSNSFRDLFLYSLCMITLSSMLSDEISLYLGLTHLITVTYIFTLIYPLIFRGFPIKYEYDQCAKRKTSTVLYYIFIVIILKGLLIVAAIIGSDTQYPFKQYILPPIANLLFVVIVPLILSLLFSFSLHFFAYGKIRLVSKIYPPRQYWMTTCTYMGNCLILTLLYSYIKSIEL